MNLRLANPLKGNRAQCRKRGILKLDAFRYPADQVAWDGNQFRVIRKSRACDPIANSDVIGHRRNDDPGRAVPQFLEVIKAVLDLTVRCCEALSLHILKHLFDQIRPGTDFPDNGSLRRLDRAAFGSCTDQ